ncbi:MAG: glutaredoxin family protein [Arenicella sp.]
MRHIILFFAIASITLHTTADANQGFKKTIKDGKVTYEAVTPEATNTAQSEQQSEKATASESKTDSNDSLNASIPVETVVLYDSPNCRQCRRIRRYFFDMKIKYLKKDISYNKNFKRELVRITGSDEVPALIIDGKTQLDLSTAAIKRRLVLTGFRFRERARRPQGTQTQQNNNPSNEDENNS